MKTNILTKLDIDIAELKRIIAETPAFEKDEQFFKQMSKVYEAKKLVADALEDIEELEIEAKGLINARAKALYGQDWQVIQGDNFKIGRSFTGQVYELTDEDIVKPEFIKAKLSPNSKTIETYRETHENALPEGVSINEHRNESIRITI